ncbi:histidine kinase [Rheinheimera muenzenbergensis]|uniref:Histidine kinase n=1 Tax=Rheinheimera muenzenbergensis TaxID=1193628 RepID=A0ABU8C103_9GAMM
MFTQHFTIEPMFTLPAYRQRIALNNCSRAYLWAQLITMLVYLLYLMAYTLPFVSVQQPGLLLAFLLKYLIEAGCFVSLGHLLLRPGLQSIQQHGISITSLFSFGLMLLLAATLQSALSYLLSQLDVFNSTDLSLLTVNNPEQQSSFQMTFSTTFILLSYGIMYAGMYLVWTFAYVLWQNWQARRLMQQQMQQARLQQLTNQLSPHFLFNAFNSIRALIFEDQQKAADTVTRLSELFRFHLQAHLQPESTLAQEWQLTEQYLAIEQVRLEQRLQFSCDIAQQLSQYKLPTLSLLTLVENAIKHGIAPNVAAGQLHISATAHNNGWRLTVTNSVQADTAQAGTATGLANLRSRLQLMYGANATLKLTQQSGQFSAQLEFSHV